MQVVWIIFIIFLVNIRNQEDTEKKHWELVNHLFNNNNWEEVEQKIVTAQEQKHFPIKVYLALLRSIKSIIPEEQRKTYVFDFSSPNSLSSLEEAMQKKLVALLDTYQWLIKEFKDKVIGTEAPKSFRWLIQKFKERVIGTENSNPLLEWCLDLNIEDIWEFLEIYKAYIWQNNRDLSLKDKLRIKDAIVHKIEEVIIWGKINNRATPKEIEEIFAFMYESYRKGDAFSLKARLRLSFLEAYLRVTFGQDISLFGQGTEHRKILEDVLDQQDLLSQGEQKDMLEMISNFAMKVSRKQWKQWKQGLDIIEHRINLDWITSQDRESYMQDWEDQKSLVFSGSDDDFAKTNSIFGRFDSWSAWESFLAKNA